MLALVFRNFFFFFFIIHNFIIMNVGKVPSGKRMLQTHTQIPKPTPALQFSYCLTSGMCNLQTQP